MSNYSKSTNFATKDSLASGNPLKVIKGTEIDDEFEAIETSIGTKADLSSPDLTGTPTAPTASAATDSTQIATTAFVQDQKTSPAFTGIPTAPTAAEGTNDTQIATTAYADTATTTHAALRSSSSVFGHAKIYVTGDTLYIETT